VSVFGWIVTQRKPAEREFSLHSSYGPLFSLSVGYEGVWLDWDNRTRPRKASGHGPWTGLRFTVNAQDIPSFVNVQPGIVVSNVTSVLIVYSSLNEAFSNLRRNTRSRTLALRTFCIVSLFFRQVLIGDPSGFPYENDLSIPRGKFGSIGVWGDTIQATPRLRTLAQSQRSCTFSRERRVLHRGYLRQNCIANCYRHLVQSNCHCSLDFIYFQTKAFNSKDDTSFTLPKV
jgi:hypothetical protein